MIGVVGLIWQNFIKKKRESLNIKQSELAETIGVSTVTLSRYENGVRQPKFDVLMKIASALNTTVASLAGETDEPAQTDNAAKSDPGMTALIKHSTLRIPLFTLASAASCGAGNGLYGVDMETAKFVSVDRADLGELDDSRKPFAIYTEGDSMINAGIEEGSKVIINPAEDVMNGDTGLVCYDGKWYIKWVVFNPDGSVELRSANPSYETIRIDKEYAKDDDWFRVIGKVVQIFKKPKSAF